MIGWWSASRGQVSFRWTDYRHGHQQKVMTLEAGEFIRWYLLHVLPGGFQRLRHYGFLSNRQRAEKLARCRQLLGVSGQGGAVKQATPDYAGQSESVTGESLARCPACQAGRLRRVEWLPPLLVSAERRRVPVLREQQMDTS